MLHAKARIEPNRLPRIGRWKSYATASSESLDQALAWARMEQAELFASSEGPL
jgi:hypothetical protein